MGTYHGATPNHFSALSHYKEISTGLSILTKVNEVASTCLNTPVEVRHNSGNSKRNDRSNGKTGTNTAPCPIRNAAPIQSASAHKKLRHYLVSARKSDTTVTYG